MESILDETVEPGSQGDPAVSLSGKEHTLHNYRFKLFFAAPRFVRDCSHSACKMPSTTKEPSASQVLAPDRCHAFRINLPSFKGRAEKVSLANLT